MTVIVGGSAGPVNMQSLSELERQIYVEKQRSSVVYAYATLEDLLFELQTRSKIVAAAIGLYDSGVRFATFERSECNEMYWNRQENGGFRLRRGVMPADGIMNIYNQGPLYAFECATAMVIVMYRAILDVIGKDAFNLYFNDLVLYDWQYDSDLRLIPVMNKQEAYPGDIVYFENPDHRPEAPEWQGENAIVLGNGLYYGHGIGIRTAEGIIAALNRERKPGSTIEAKQADLVLHMDFNYLKQLAATGSSLGSLTWRSEQPIIARVGIHIYMSKQRQISFLGFHLRA